MIVYVNLTLFRHISGVFHRYFNSRSSAFRILSWTSGFSSPFLPSFLEHPCRLPGCLLKEKGLEFHDTVIQLQPFCVTHVGGRETVKYLGAFSRISCSRLEDSKAIIHNMPLAFSRTFLLFDRSSINREGIRFRAPMEALTSSLNTRFLITPVAQAVATSDELERDTIPRLPGVQRRLHQISLLSREQNPLKPIGRIPNSTLGWGGNSMLLINTMFYCDLHQQSLLVCNLHAFECGLVAPRTSAFRKQRAVANVGRFRCAIAATFGVSLAHTDALRLTTESRKVTKRRTPQCSLITDVTGVRPQY